jgi:Cyclic nucleotide-binding domain
MFSFAYNVSVVVHAGKMADSSEQELGTNCQVSLIRFLLQALLTRLVPCMRHGVYNPGDYVCQKGDVGKEMYIVKSGQLVVVDDDGKTVYATLSEGAYFGEACYNIEFVTTN